MDPIIVIMLDSPCCTSLLGFVAMLDLVWTQLKPYMNLKVNVVKYGYTLKINSSK